jgi:hypothetical protein
MDTSVEHHSRASDRFWDWIVKVSAALTVAVCLWAVNAESRLRDADRTVVLVSVQRSEIAELQTGAAVAKEQRANVTALLSEIRADVKKLLSEKK